MSGEHVPGGAARLAVLLTLPAVFLAAGATGADRTPVYALVGGHIVTGTGATIPKGTIVVRDGLIQAVARDAAVPPDARVLDVSGLTVTAGLIDGFGGLGLAAEERRAGAASPRPTLTPEARALDRVRAAEVVEARDQGVTTALAVPAAGVLPGASVLLNLSGESPEAMVLAHPAAFHLHMATLRRVYPGSLMGTVALARQSLLDARRYGQEWDAYRRSPRGRTRPRYDASLEAWQDVVAGRLPLVVTAPRENDLRRALALAHEFGVKVIAADARRAFRVADLVKARALPLLVSVNFDPPVAPASGFGSGPDEEKLRKEIEEAERNPAALHEAGVAFALVSGHAPDFLKGVRKAMERGLPPDAALRAVTVRPAEVLGVADRLGTVEAGKIANLVVWPGEPLAASPGPKMVFVDGRLFEPEPIDPSPAPQASPATGSAP